LLNCTVRGPGNLVLSAWNVVCGFTLPGGWIVKRGPRKRAGEPLDISSLFASVEIDDIMFSKRAV
jgi:hypothetical protein